MVRNGRKIFISVYIFFSILFPAFAWGAVYSVCVASAWLHLRCVAPFSFDLKYINRVEGLVFDCSWRNCCLKCWLQVRISCYGGSCNYSSIRSSPNPKNIQTTMIIMNINQFLVGWNLVRRHLTSHGNPKNDTTPHKSALWCVRRATMVGG